MAIDVQIYLSLVPVHPDPITVLLQDNLAWEVGSIAEVERLIDALIDAKIQMVRIKQEQLEGP